MDVSSLPRAQSDIDLALTPRVTDAPAARFRTAAATNENWDSLFRLIMARLRLTVEEYGPELSVPEVRVSFDKVQSSVLECVDGLSQIYRVLTAPERSGAPPAQFTRLPTSVAQMSEKRARYRALHDDLTSLPNGDYFRLQLEQALSSAALPQQALAVLYLKLGDFNPSVEAYGSDAGDELLRLLAARLAMAGRAEDMLSRLGRDDFVCLVPGLWKRQQLSEIAAKLLAVVADPLEIGHSTVAVRPNIGIAIYPQDGTTVEGLLANAVFAMHRARQHDVGHAFVGEI
jgi:diguanylate cyclase (GGDEF)-like protein